ncbi:class I SAM-dependent methyltransferase [Micromonospora luteifusca]|uniref:class I SAM-dependent methyltransferase n=1 Tax=Micromonospora luteifusca TaxID=709860 RepID=UPI0033BC428C
MTSIVNTQQSEMWNGYEGNRWATEEDRWDSLNGVFNEDMLAAAAIGEQDAVLDIGCGNGQTTRLAAERTTGEVVGIDISVPMLDRANAAAEGLGLTNLRFAHGDAQVHPFPDAAFDVVISRFGLTFFAEPIVALANIGRAMRPGGRLAAICVGNYGQGDWAPVLGAMAGSLPLDFLNAPNPRDALADPDSIDHVLTGAGFTNVTTTEVVRPNVWGRDPEDAADFLLSFGPVRLVMEQVDEGIANKARQAVAEAFAPHQQPEGVRMNTPAWLISASRP